MHQGLNMSEKISSDVKIMNRKARALRRRVMSAMVTPVLNCDFSIQNGILKFQNKTIKSEGKNKYFFGDDNTPHTLKDLVKIF
jgi:hypothetical protein